MPELNPLSNEQIFLKKIAENTGSDYNTGDVSEINPLTIDQILLKEIAANTAGQSGDITELEEKVAANTSAIEAIVNEYGAKNLLPNNAKSQTIADGTITVNSDGSIRTNISTANGVAYDITDYFTVPAGNYIFSKGMTLGQSQIWLQFFNGSTFVRDVKLKMDASQSIIIDYDGYTQLKCVGYIPPSTTIDTTLYPMIRDARITDSTYAPYAMTNRELTDELTWEEKQELTPTSGTPWSNYGYCYYRKRGTTVELNLSLTDVDNASSLSIYTLPDGYRPIINIAKTALCVLTSISNAGLYIDTDGVIRITNGVGYYIANVTFETV